MPLSVRRTIVVEVDQSRAFNVFTARVGVWWPSAYYIGAAPFETAIIEPNVGGRWFERGTDGTECDWGRVLAWQPVERLVLAWQISADWKFDPDLTTEIEVNFSATSPNHTLVEFEHRHLERYGDRAAEMHAIFDSGGVPGAPQGWGGLLKAYAATTAR